MAFSTNFAAIFLSHGVAVRLVLMVIKHLPVSPEARIGAGLSPVSVQADGAAVS